MESLNQASSIYSSGITSYENLTDNPDYYDTNLYGKNDLFGLDNGRGTREYKYIDNGESAVQPTPVSNTQSAAPPSAEASGPVSASYGSSDQDSVDLYFYNTVGGIVGSYTYGSLGEILILTIFDPTLSGTTQVFTNDGTPLGYIQADNTMDLGYVFRMDIPDGDVVIGSGSDDVIIDEDGSEYVLTNLYNESGAPIGIAATDANDFTFLAQLENNFMWHDDNMTLYLANGTVFGYLVPDIFAELDYAIAFEMPEIYFGSSADDDDAVDLYNDHIFEILNVDVAALVNTNSDYFNTLLSGDLELIGEVLDTDIVIDEYLLLINAIAEGEHLTYEAFEEEDDEEPVYEEIESEEFFAAEFTAPPESEELFINLEITTL